MSRVRDKLIQLKKEYASYDEHDGIYAEEVREMIDDLLADLHEGGKDYPAWCEWTLIDVEFNAYDTSCRNPWYLEAGTPEDNKMIYCPACGRKIKVVKEKIRLEDVTRCPYCNYIPKCNEQTCKDCKVYEDFLDDAERFRGNGK